MNSETTNERIRASKKSMTPKEIEAFRKKGSELVRGRFKNYEVPGGMLEFSHGPEYKGDKQYNYRKQDGTALIDGEIYELPRSVARHLNTNCWYPQFDRDHGEEFIGHNSDRVVIKKKVHRFGFQSLEFEGDDMMPTPTLFQVETNLISS